MTGPDGELTLADVQREFSGWRCWRGISGLYYARRAGAQPGDHADVKGEDPLDLRDEIIRAQSKIDEVSS